MPIVIHSALTEVNPEHWNALIERDYPFLKHEFLSGLETTGCVSVSNGWTPSHIALYDTSVKTLVAAMPCYEKTHSYGEYIFDWAWADAYFRHGLNYYPKLSSAVPFTPATGQRFLFQQGQASETLQHRLLTAARELCIERDLSSWHGLFLNRDEIENTSKSSDYLVRHSNQFHWQNQDYADFEQFLGTLTSKKRKNIKRERRRIADMNVQYRWITGAELTPEVMATMYKFYQRTIGLYGAQAYLNVAFFKYLADHFSDNTLVLFAYFDDQIIAGGLYFKGDDVLYGRYWGALDNFHSVHFETCYYQAIEWCIEQGFARFEAGAQGEHKLARGLSPATTYSAHWFKDQRFHDAIEQFIEQEQSQVARYQNSVTQHSPYRDKSLTEL